jgi:NodT family efflux transporter outer membrane factor (OMF) lipoprotein
MSRSFVPLAAALVLAGCAAVPKLGPQPQAKAPQAYATAESFQAPAAPWPADRWWAAYGDAQLSALVDEALAGAPSLAEAQARVRRAEALAQQAGAARLPSAALNAEAAEAKQSYNTGIPAQFVPKGYNDTGRVTLDLGWDLDLWGRNRAALLAATSEAEAARLDAVQARLMLTTGLVSAYAEFARLFGQRQAAEQAQANRQASARLVAERVEGGAANPGEARQAASAASAAGQDLAALDEQIALARYRLAALAGEGPDRGLALQRPATAPDTAFGLPTNLAADLLGRRPDLQAARLRTEAAARRIRVARAGFYPNINLAAFIGAQSLGLDVLTKSGSDIGQAAVAVSLPIFSGGRLEGAYRGARADYDAAVAAYDQTLVQALQEVADAAASQRALQGRLALARAALSDAEEGYRIARLRYEGGLTGYLTALTAEDAAIAQRRAVADLEARAMALDAALARALGGGFRAS